MSDYHVLVQIEVGGNQRYIFESNRLRDIRGASALLDQVNRFAIPGIVHDHDAEVIRATGGVTVAGFKLADGETMDMLHVRIDNLVRAIREEYASKIPGVSLYTGRVLCEGLSVNDQFSALSLDKSMDQWHRPRIDAHPFLGGPMIKFCQACGVRPADTIWPLEEEYICSVCDTKRRFGKKSRTGDDGSDDDPDSEPSMIVQKFFHYVQEEEKDPKWQGYQIKKVLPRDFEELGDLAGGQIGLLMADGNRLGQTLQGFDTIKKVHGLFDGDCGPGGESRIRRVAAVSP